MSMPRLKTPLHLAIDSDLHKQLRDWIERQEVQPSMTAVLEAALREWLAARPAPRRRG